MSTCEILAASCCERDGTGQGRGNGNKALEFLRPKSSALAATGVARPARQRNGAQGNKHCTDIQSLLVSFLPLRHTEAFCGRSKRQRLRSVFLDVGDSAACRCTLMFLRRSWSDPEGQYRTF